MAQFRVLICGGRDFNDFGLVEQEVLKLVKPHEDKDIVFISGGAKGADSMARLLVQKYESKLEEYLADWKDLTVEPCIVKKNKYGSYNALAGHNRNTRMLLEGSPDVVLAFWDGRSHGTADMIKKVRDAKVPLIIVNY